MSFVIESLPNAPYTYLENKMRRSVELYRAHMVQGTRAFHNLCALISSVKNQSLEYALKAMRACDSEAVILDVYEVGHLPNGNEPCLCYKCNHTIIGSYLWDGMFYWCSEECAKKAHYPCIELPSVPPSIDGDYVGWMKTLGKRNGDILSVPGRDGMPYFGCTPDSYIQPVNGETTDLIFCMAGENIRVRCDNGIHTISYDDHRDYPDDYK